MIFQIFFTFCYSKLKCTYDKHYRALIFFYYHGCVQLLLNGGLHSLAAVTWVVDGKGLGEEQGCVCTHLKIWNLTLQKRDFSERKTSTRVRVVANLPSYAQRFPENGLVEVVKHLVHSVTAFFRVEVVQNLHRRTHHCVGPNRRRMQVPQAEDLNPTSRTLLSTGDDLCSRIAFLIKS